MGLLWVYCGNIVWVYARFTLEMFITCDVLWRPEQCVRRFLPHTLSVFPP